MSTRAALALAITLAISLGVAGACGGGDPPPPKEVLPPSALPPRGCADYINEIEGLLDCPKIAPATRDQLDQSLQAMAKTWVDYEHRSPAVQAAIVSGCAREHDSLVETATSICPP